MVRPVRPLLVALSVALLIALPVTSSAKKRISKKKARSSRATMIVVPPVFQMEAAATNSSPVAPTATNGSNTTLMLAEGHQPSAGTIVPPASSNTNVGGSGDSEGTGKRSWINFPAAPKAGSLIISEFRLQGPSGSDDEFIEIYNDSGANHTVAASSGTGYGIAASDGILRCTIPNGTVIPARGHFLCANSGGYSLSTYAAADATYTTEITDGEDPDGAGPNPPLAHQGIALFNNNSGGGSFILANRFDAVGSTSEANVLYKEGTGYPTLTFFSIDYAWVRDECGKGGSITTMGLCSISTPKDTDNNAADFYFVDTNGTSAGAGQRLGAPGPQNLASALQRNSTFTVNLLDATVSNANPPNRVRDFTSVPANNSTFGTLSIRRRWVNNTGGNVTQLRFRIIDLTTFPAPSGFADLRPRTSGAVVVAGINDSVTCTTTGAPVTPPCTATVQGTTLEQPPNQPNGSGFNGSMSAGTVTLLTPLANGASINLQFLLGIQQTGTFKFYVNVEALP